MSDLKASTGTNVFDLFQSGVVEFWNGLSDVGTSIFSGLIRRASAEEHPCASDMDSFWDDLDNSKALVSYDAKHLPPAKTLPTSWACNTSVHSLLSLPVELTFTREALGKLDTMFEDAWHIAFCIKHKDDEKYYPLYEISRATMRMQELREKVPVIERDEAFSLDEIGQRWGCKPDNFELSFIWHYYSMDGVKKQQAFKVACKNHLPIAMADREVKLNVDYCLYDHHFEIWGADCVIDLKSRS